MAELFLRTLEKAELFGLLEEGHAAQVSVVTPNRRLARALTGAFDRHQAERGRRAWEAADILPLSALAERLYDEACSAEGADPLPNLLTADQELALWERHIRHSSHGRNLLAISETAALACEAWSLAHAWHLMPALAGTAIDEDSAAFSDWAQRYAVHTKRAGLTERARLPQAVEQALHLTCVRKPALLVVWGFDILTPQQHALMRAFAARGVALARGQAGSKKGSAVLHACANAEEEIQFAVRWARTRFEAAQRAAHSAGNAPHGPAREQSVRAELPCIGIVIPDLALRRNLVRRTLQEILAPDLAAPDAGTRSLLFNVSLGEGLSAVPLIRHALEALSLGGRGMEFERISLVVRSPFLAGAETEAARRSTLDAALRRHARPELSLDVLLSLMRREDMPRAPLLAQRLIAYAEFRRSRLFSVQTTRSWGVTFSDALKLLGFPGERTLDSTEYQALAKWYEMLVRFARLDLVVAEIGFQEALGRLQRMANGNEFQPETPEAPIQVLGVLEAAGMEFDHLWVSGLTDATWPLHPRANPFIPFAAQRAAGAPNASPAETLSLARRLTAGWLDAAGETVLSFALREADQDLKPSALIAGSAAAALAPPVFSTWRDAIRSRGAAMPLAAVDDPAPPAAIRSVRGAGISLLKNQAACPFRAFARHRLAAQPMHEPHTGLDPMERGTLVHAALAAAWREIQTRADLDVLDDGELAAVVARAAEWALARGPGYGAPELRGRFGRIEHARLSRLTRGWLEYERVSRAGFPGYRVAELEARHEVEIGGLTLSVRLDRVDETTDGERIVIDYKTGSARLPSILRARLDEPQLPLYLNSVEPAAGAVAFAQIRAEGMQFVGLARAEGLLPGVSTPQKAERRSGAQADWPAQRVFWQNELEQLARAYLEGRAEVDPKRRGATCRECDLHALCRIAQRSQVAGEID